VLLLGNESNTGHHTSGVIPETNATHDIQIRVPENANSFPISVWAHSANRMSVSIKSPVGENIPRVPAKSGIISETKLILEKATVIVRYYFPVLGSGSELIIISILNPTPGIWTVTLHGDIIIDGIFDSWLHITGFLSPGIQFLTPDPYKTITVPATGVGCITCGAYNDKNGSLYINSSWGPNREMLNSPDLVAPGVDVLGFSSIGNGLMTGTSVATAITAGACSLMLQWGIVEQNDLSLNTYRIKAYLIRGCRRDPDIQYPSHQWGYGELDLFNTFNQLRP